MKIMLLNDRIPPENRGGAGEVVWRLARGLFAQGHDVHVVAATEKASFREVREGIMTYHLHSRYPDRWRAWLSLYNPQTIPQIKALYQEIRPDVINAHNIHTDLSYASLREAHRLGIPAVFSSHDVMLFAYHKLNHFVDPARCGVRTADDYRLPPLYNLRQMRLRYNPLRNVAIRQILTRYVQVRTAPAQELCDAHHANHLPPFVCVHNGIDPQQFEASAATVNALRERLNLVERKVILFAGRLTAAKGTRQLLDALQRVIRDVPETALLVLSSVPIAEQVQDAHYAQLRERHLVSGGWLAGEELAAAYHLCDVVTVPSVVFDTFPTVNLEAMAARKPVIATCYGGSREAVLDGETGYLVNPFDSVDFAAKLSRLLLDDALRQQMGAAGFERVRQQFSIEMQVSAMLGCYQQAQRQKHRHNTQ